MLHFCLSCYTYNDWSSSGAKLLEVRSWWSPISLKFDVTKGVGILLIILHFLKVLFEATVSFNFLRRSKCRQLVVVIGQRVGALTVQYLSALQGSSHNLRVTQPTTAYRLLLLELCLRMTSLLTSVLMDGYYAMTWITSCKCLEEFAEMVPRMNRGSKTCRKQKGRGKWHVQYIQSTHNLRADETEW